MWMMIFFFWLQSFYIFLTSVLFQLPRVIHIQTCPVQPMVDVDVGSTVTRGSEQVQKSFRAAAAWQCEVVPGAQIEKCNKYIRIRGPSIDFIRPGVFAVFGDRVRCQLNKIYIHVYISGFSVVGPTFTMGNASSCLHKKRAQILLLGNLPVNGWYPVTGSSGELLQLAPPR